MRPGPIVVVDVLRQNLAQMPFADHDDVVKAFASNRANHPLAYCPKTRPTLKLPDSSSATGRPSGRDNESRGDRPREEPVQSNRCRDPGDSAPRGSAPQTL